MAALGRLGLTVLGNMAFGPFGGLIGGVVGSFLFPDQMQDQHSEGPRLSDFTFTGSSYAAGIPWVWGHYSVPGNVIWLGTVNEHDHTTEEEVGGKGGGGATYSYTTYTYSVSFALGLCKGPMKRVMKIFMNNQLVYDAFNKDIADRVVNPSFRFYPGDETQLPDSIIEAKEGAGNVPGHRGLCYLVFDELDITPFGNALPQIKVIVQGDGEGTNYSEAIFSGVGDSVGAAIYDLQAQVAYKVNSSVSDGVTVIDLANRQTVATYQAKYSDGQIVAAFDGELYVQHDLDALTTVIKVLDGLTGQEKLSGESLSIGSGRSGNVVITPAKYYSADGEERHVVFVSITQWSTALFNPQFLAAQWLDTPAIFAPTNMMGYLPLANRVNSFFCRLPDSSDRPNAAKLIWMHAKVAPGGGAYINRMTVEIVTVTDTMSGLSMGPSISTRIIGEFSVTDLDPSGNLTDLSGSGIWGPNSAPIDGVVYDESDDTLIISAWARQYIIKMSMSGQILWQFTNPVPGVIGATAGQYLAMPASIKNATLPIVGRLGGVNGTTVLRLLDTRTGQLLADPPQNSIPTLGVPFGYISDSNVILNQRSLLFIDRSEFVNVPVEDILRPIGEEVSAAPQDFTEVADLTVNGYAMARPMPARDAITPIARLYQFDAVESAGTLRWVRRGQAPVATIPYDDLVPGSDDNASAIEYTRTQEPELPQAVSVTYADRTRDYEVNTANAQRFAGNVGYETMRSQNKVSLEVPAAITGDVAKRFAEINLMTAWNGRTSQSFSLPPYGVLFDPGDVVTLNIPGRFPDDVMILKQDSGADLKVDLQSVSQDSAQYISRATQYAGDGFVPPQIALATRIMAVPIGSPLPYDSLDNGRTALLASVAASSLSGFSRPVIAGRARTDGTYETVGAITKPATIGTLTESLAAPDAVFSYDTEGRISVRMVYGTLESINKAQLLAGQNLSIIVRPDNTVEFIQFQNAELVGPNTYTLTGLLRGRRGTDAFARDTAPAGSRFLLLATGSFLIFQEPLAALGNSETIRLWYDGTDPAKGTVLPVPVTGRDLMPYAPVHVEYVRAGNNDHTFSWVRRTRIGGDLAPYLGDVPLNEDAEKYEIELDDGYKTVVYQSDTPTYTYTDAQRILDGLHNGFSAVVYQMSTQVNRGFPSQTKTTTTRAQVAKLAALRLAKPIPSMRVAEIAQLTVRQSVSKARTPIFTQRIIKTPSASGNIAGLSAIVIKKVP